jgi:hypothetical protein
MATIVSCSHYGTTFTLYLWISDSTCVVILPILFLARVARSISTVNSTMSAAETFPDILPRERFMLAGRFPRSASFHFNTSRAGEVAESGGDVVIYRRFSTISSA